MNTLKSWLNNFWVWNFFESRDKCSTYFNSLSKYNSNVNHSIHILSVVKLNAGKHTFTPKFKWVRIENSKRNRRKSFYSLWLKVNDWKKNKSESYNDMTFANRLNTREQPEVDLLQKFFCGNISIVCLFHRCQSLTR